MPVGLKETNTNASGTAPPAATATPPQPDDAFSLFLPESQQTEDRTARSAAVQVDTPPRREPPTSITAENARTSVPRDQFEESVVTSVEAVRQIENTFNALDVVRDLARTVDSRFAALKQLEQNISSRTSDLEAFGQRIVEVRGRVDEAARLMKSFDGQFAALSDRDQKAGAALAHVAELERRATSLAVDLDRRLTACQTQDHLIAHTVEQLARRAADAASDLEHRANEFEARTRLAERTLAELQEPTSRRIGDLQQHLQDVDARQRLLDQGIAEAKRLNASLSALHERLPEVTRCDEERGRIEQAIPHLARQLGDLNVSVEQHVAILEAGNLRVQQTLGEIRVTSDVVTQLETRIADLKEKEHQLDPVDQYVAKLEQRITALGGRKPLVQQTFEETRKASEALSALETRIADLTKRHQQLDRIDQQVEQMGERVAALEAKKKLVQQTLDETQRVSAVLSALETRIADLIKSDQRLDRIDKHVGQLEQRAAAAVGQLKQATRSKQTLEQEFAELQDRIKRLTASAQDDARKLGEHGQQRDRSSPAQISFRRAVDPFRIFRLARQALGALPPLPSAGRLAGGVAILLVLAVVAAVWSASFIRSERQTGPNPVPVLAGRSLAFAPLAAVSAVLPTAIGLEKRAVTDQRPAPVAAAAPDANQATTAPQENRTAAPPIDRPRDSRVETTQFIGTLAVDSEPSGATVFINQRPVGDTPVLLKDLRAGSYVVRVEREGYQRWSSAVTVSTVRETHVTARLQPDNPR